MISSSSPPMNDEHMSNEQKATILAVRPRADGYWYIGAGRSIAEGPYRHPDELLAVASDLLATEPRWRIEVYDAGGSMIVSYSSEELAASELHPAHRQTQWHWH